MFSRTNYQHSQVVVTGVITSFFVPGIIHICTSIGKHGWHFLGKRDQKRENQARNTILIVVTVLEDVGGAAGGSGCTNYICTVKSMAFSQLKLPKTLKKSRVVEAILMLGQAYNKDTRNYMYTRERKFL